jgi:AraC-like DNA-binding protein
MKYNIPKYKTKLKDIIKSKFFRNNLILFLVVSILPLAIIGTSSYYIGIGQIEKEVNQTHKLQLEYVFESMDKQLNQLESSFNQWSFYRDFNDKFKSIDLSREFYVTHDLYRLFDLLNNSSPIIENVSLYVEPQQAELSEKGIFYLNGNLKQNLYSDLLQKSSTIFWTNTLPEDKKDNSFPVSLVQKIPGGSPYPYGLLYVNLSQKHIQTMIEQLNPDKEGASFILNSTGDWLTSESISNNSKHHLEESLRSQVLNHHSTSGSFNFKWENKKYAVTFGTLTKTGWKYVVATPLSKLTAPATLLSRMMILVSILVLILALLLSWFASTSLYKPIKRLVSMFDDKSKKEDLDINMNEIYFIENSWKNLTSEKLALKEKVDRSRHSLREGFILQLVQGHLYFLTEKELRDQMAQYWWNAEEKVFSLILVRVEIKADTKRKFTEDDEQLLTFATANILEELCHEKWGESVIVNFHDLTVAAILPFSEYEDAVTIKSKCLIISDIFLSALTHYLGVNVFIVVGKTVSALNDINKSLDEARHGLRYRNFEKNEQILLMDNLIPQGDYQTSYSFSLENSIIQAMRMGMREDALQFLEEFIKKLKMDMSQEFLFRQSLFQLLGRILETLLKSGLNMQFVYQGSNLYEQLSTLNNSAEIVRWFDKKLISPYSKEIAKTREKQLENLVQKVVNTIESDYNQPISLDFCANACGITAYSLSKIFKKVTGINFVDYLTQIRIEHAKDLLLSSDAKISDIAERVGYQPGYFVRSFKKAEGVTPGQYRELHMKNYLK